MTSNRLNVRLPEKYIREIEAAARAGGYASSCQLARCVLVRFIDYCRRTQAKMEQHEEWIDEFIADHADPQQRRQINERL